MEKIKIMRLAAVGMLLGAFALTMLSACNSSTSPGNSTASSVAHPKLGSTYTDSSYDKDTNL
jgi:hypothetical protein